MMAMTAAANDADRLVEDWKKFRSVLAHEPLPNEVPGYILVQGAFTPKQKVKADDEACETLSSEIWSLQSLQPSVVDRLNAIASELNDVQNPVLEAHIIEPATPLTKVRLVCKSSAVASQLVDFFRRRKVSPRSLLSDDESSEVFFGSHPFQWTQLTTFEILSMDRAWNRSSPPKFRRLLPKPGEDAAVLEAERSQTRFVFLSNLLTAAASEVWCNPHAIISAVRDLVGPFDTSGLGVEVFVAHNKLKHCHVGMRSPGDAQALISSTLQGQRVVLKSLDENGKSHSTTSGRLFLDYAAVTHRSLERLEARAQGLDPEKGQPERSECTSTTAHVHVPGLVVIPDFCNEDEEQALLATLMGPLAPWAPVQCTPTDGRVVRRKVQHYGYVFDYQTANVLRDRSIPGADCPAMPAQPDDLPAGDLETSLKSFADRGDGWHVLAGTVERVRRYEFDTPTRKFPNLNQLTVNVYKPGEGIGSHVDTPSAFGDGLISISLGSGIVMEFRKVGCGTQEDGRKLVYLPPRSLLLMSGAARYEWEHMIVTRSTDTVDGQVLRRKVRLSLTLRTALDESAQPMPLVSSHQFPPKWHSLKDSASPFATPACERDHVHLVYDAIATQWHHTRGRRGVLWPGATQFVQRLPAGSVVADVGCGDGKYFPAIWEAGSYVIGTDISLPLLKTAFVNSNSDDGVPESRRVGDERHHLQQRPAVAVADCIRLPFRTNSCDAAICIAVLHHISTPSRRKRCIEELARIVKPGGLINIQAWALEQEEGSRHRFASNDVFVPFNAQPKYLALNRTSRAGFENEPGRREDANATMSTAQQYSELFNAEYDDQKGLVVFQRYCHLYKEGELEDLCQQIPNVDLIERGFESGNHFVVLEVTR